jgi:hypothetical protein
VLDLLRRSTSGHADGFYRVPKREFLMGIAGDAAIGRVADRGECGGVVALVREKRNAGGDFGVGRMRIWSSRWRWRAGRRRRGGDTVELRSAVAGENAWRKRLPHRG